MFSIIIPTMQKNAKVFNMLLDELVSDSIIGEIIVIDNSLKGINYHSDKIRVITPRKNIFVNPAWNLGVKNAKYDLIGILNDDLIFPKNFFSDVHNFLSNTKNVGFVGLAPIPKAEDKDFVEYPLKTTLSFDQVIERKECWGSAIFCSKSKYFKIPEKLKVWCGDDYLFHKSMDNGLTNYTIANSNVMHLHSLTSDRKEFDKIKRKDQKYYSKINPQYKFAIKGNTFIENIFSIKNSGDKKHKIITILGIKISIKINLYTKLHKNFIKIEKQLRVKNTINITFMVSLVSMFPALPLFEYLLRNNSKYNPKILIIPDFRFGIENAHKIQEECYKELSTKYGTKHIITVPIDEEEDHINVREFTDILFCSLPYDVSHPKYNLDNLVKLNLLPAMVNYGYFRSTYDRTLVSSEGYSKYWKVFVENEQNLQEYKNYQIIKGDNCVLTGYCKMDNYAQYENELGNNHSKTIMIAPHHSVDGGFNDILALSNFYKYANLFLKLPDLYPNLNFIFRPHPALFPCLSKEDFWGQCKVEKYISAMNAKSNVRYSESGDYLKDFAESDALIQDCGSFLVDYFYTQKPQCYMLKNKEQIIETFSAFGQDCLNNVYQAFSEQDILKFIDSVVICEQDTMKERRTEFAHNKVMINYPNVAQEITKYFDKTFGEPK